MGFSELGAGEKACDEQNSQDEVGVDVAIAPEIVEVGREHVHELGDEAKHAEGKMPD